MQEVVQAHEDKCTSVADIVAGPQSDRKYLKATPAAVYGNERQFKAVPELVEVVLHEWGKISTAQLDHHINSM